MQVTQTNDKRAPRAERARVIDSIDAGPGFHWVGDGFRVKGYMRPELLQKLSPFLLLDYHPPYNYEATDNLRRGVGPHPHRGFETVTLSFSGSVEHHDSTGSGGVIGPGDVQWMTAGAGILHREYHEASYAKQGGPFHVMQIWVNLPRANKMTRPGYQALTADQMGVVELPDQAGRVRVIAGAFQGVKGPAKTFTPINMYDVTLAKSGKVQLSFPPTENVALLVMSGALNVNGRLAKAEDLVVFKNEGDELDLAATEDTRFIVLNGEPIREPIAQYGPFVMNDRREIMQAIDDFNQGKFGVLAE